jgi:hypothetical protein
MLPDWVIYLVVIVLTPLAAMCILYARDASRGRR